VQSIPFRSCGRGPGRSCKTRHWSINNRPVPTGLMYTHSKMSARAHGSRTSAASSVGSEAETWTIYYFIMGLFFQFSGAIRDLMINALRKSQVQSRGAMPTALRGHGFTVKAWPLRAVAMAPRSSLVAQKSIVSRSVVRARDRDCWIGRHQGEWAVFIADVGQPSLAVAAGVDATTDDERAVHGNRICRFQLPAR
jgi:hypothetical protein